MSATHLLQFSVRRSLQSFCRASSFFRSCARAPTACLPSVSRTSARTVYTVEDAKKDCMLAIQETQHIPSGPIPAIVLGTAGIIPFVAVPLMCLSDGFDPSWEYLQVAYGASILSFLGGIRWGMTIDPRTPSANSANYETLGLAVSPSIAAWLSLLFPTPIGLITVAAGLIGMGYMDIFMSTYPSWYKGLRFALTAVAVGSLLLTLVFHLVLSKRDTKKTSHAH